MRRRDLLASIGTAMLPIPAIAQSSRAKTLRFVPESNLVILDPMLTISTSTQDHGVCIYDTLYGVDSQFVAKPQMSAGHTVSDDGRTWTIVLRDGLRFHDGEPVRAADCAASMARWCKRDPFGLLIARLIERWEAADDRTLRIKLTRPFPGLIDAIARPAVAGQFIMPERVARTDPATAITDMTGSGPFRFVPGEYVSGSRVVYDRFQGYVPRAEPADYTSGGKVVHFDRFEWQVIPDVATAAAALRTGEVDWLEIANSDMIPLFARSANIRLQMQDLGGRMSFLRFNTLQPPFNNPAIRRAVLQAVTQSDYMDVTAGGDAELTRTCYSMFPCKLPMVNEAGTELMKPPRDLARSQARLKQAGYAGEKVVILSASDIEQIRVYGDVTADLLRRLGMNVDLQSMDWGSLLQRRTSREPVSNGGWSVFPATFSAAQIGTAPTNSLVRGLGAAGYAGGFEDAVIEMLTGEYVEAGSTAERQRIIDAIQTRAFDLAPSVPLGQWFRKTAFRRDIEGIMPAWVSLPWNVRRV